jgi:VWFA-related protein
MHLRIFFFLAALVTAGIAADHTNSPAPLTAKAVAHLDLSVAGYKELSAMARRSDMVNFTIHFIDRDHILLTYNPKKMIRRLPECPPTHEDHFINAAVLEVRRGTVLHSVEWYLHDGRRYLWPLGSGKFLLRRLNTLYEIDADLSEKLLYTSPQDLLWTSVTPDGKQVIAETADSDGKGKAKSKGVVRIEFRDAQSMTVQRVIKSEKEIQVEATSSGFASAIPGLGRRVWLIRFGPSEHQRDNIARVRTQRRAPDILYPSSNTMVIGRDSASHPGYSVSAFTVTGNRLWRQHWDEHRYSLFAERSEDGSRFAISTLRPLNPPATPRADSSDTPMEGLKQTVQVFNTASGDPVLTVDAEPVVLSGQNFALSPDGRKLAVLDGSAIDLYDLPEMSQEERAKYTAVKADVPGLYAPPAPAVASDQEVAFTAPDANGAVPESLQLASANSSATGTTQPKDNPPPVVKAAGVATAGSVPLFRSQRQIVALDVVVADAKGHPIKGVPKQDFVIKEDGKTQTLSYFNEVSANPPAVAQEKPAVVEAGKGDDQNQRQTNIFNNASPPKAPTAVTLILYDLLNTDAPDQQRAKLELLNFIQHKPKDDRFALCTLSNGLHMVQGFTPDEGILTHAVKQDKGSLRYGSMLGEDAADRMLVGWLQQGIATAAAQFGSKAGVSSSALADQAGRLEQEMEERRSRDLELRMAVTMDAFTQIARYLSALPGRKSLIWLSGSFPLGIFPGMDFRNPYAENKTSTEQMKQAVNLLAESHVAVYPVDVKGLTTYAMAASTGSAGLGTTQPGPSPAAFNHQASPQQRFDELSNLNAAGGIGPNLPQPDPFMDDAMDHGMMNQIAADTGGKAFFNVNGIEQAMTIAMEQETNYYALSYTPLNGKYDGKFRRIKVSMVSGDKKYHVIHRSGYFAVDPNAPSPLSRDATTGFGLAAMQHDAPQSRQLVFEARVVPIGKPLLEMDPRAAHSVPAKKKKKHAADPPPTPIEMQRYQIDYAIHPSQLRFDPTSDGLEHGAMNFMVASFDANGTARTSIGSHVNGDLKPDSYQDVMTGGIRLRQEVDVPVAAASLRLGVQDAISGRIGTLEIPLPVKAPPGVEQSRSQRLPEIEPD